MRILFAIAALAVSTTANAQTYNTTITRVPGQTMIETRMQPSYEPRPSIVYIPKPTDADDRRSYERDTAWRLRCNPTIGLPDALGVRRYSYTAPGCEFGD